MLALLNGLWMSAWRRIYGEGQFTGLIGNRTFQALIFIALQTAFWGYSWLNLAIAIYVYAMYWSKAVGSILDCGTAWWQKAKNYGRWWTKPLCWIIKKCGYEKYGKEYDFFWTICRYTLCLLPLIYFGHHIWVAGLFSAPIYFTMKKVFEKNPKWYKVFDDSKDASELIFGFTTGVIFYLGWQYE